MTDALSKGGCCFIEAGKLTDQLHNARPDHSRVREIIAKSGRKQPLEVAETATLLAVTDPELLQEIFAAARRLKQEVYGNRLVLFAPLYIGNFCVNDCRYCSFRHSLASTVRHTLSNQELTGKVRQLETLGHKRLTLVYGEHPQYTPEFIADTVRFCYQAGKAIRRININAAPQSVSGFATLKAAQIGTYQLFQETYHPELYALYHPRRTRKGNYLWRLDGLDRALEGGCDDVGFGVLLGLCDWRFETLALVSHAVHLQQKYGLGPHSISLPRLTDSCGFTLNYPVSDRDFKRMVAILRLAIPYCGLIISTRDTAAISEEILPVGISQLNAGPHLEFAAGTREPTMDEVMHWLLERDFLPSFCTSCYRHGRNGVHRMEYAIPGFTESFCTPNAILTLAEYLEENASASTKELGYRQIDRELARLRNTKRVDAVKERLQQIRSGERELYF